ncbi:MAG: hypothetical protein COB67_00015 [SAR324 cluster bacterium]|uniref:Uncharacterized protein n=1 Tax=SAR324 cluster bacterium TaxID=2024889 RepID=A0A2A4TBX4_9DELT|nr:MAG: hypothetical protein COB67_00015 [SAR324 cluster bacterium]
MKKITTKSVNRILIHKDELKTHQYQEYKNMPHVLIEREDTADEYLVFFTISPEMVKCLVEGESL